MGKVVCLYGSVTGKAMSIAEQVVELGQNKGMEISLHCLGEVGKSWSLDQAKTIIIVSSTTGDGEQPENVIKFWRKLRPKNLGSDHLSHVQFALLGLGDTNYNQFCAAPKALNRRLLELGATPFYPAAWADDGTGLEVVVEPWIEGLWEAVEAMEKGNNNTRDDIAKPSDKLITSAETLSTDLSSLTLKPLTLPPCPKSYISISYSDSSVASFSTTATSSLPLSPFPSSAGPPLAGTVQRCSLLTSTDAAKLCYQVLLSCPAFEHQAGDTISVICNNTEQEIQQLSCRLELEDVWQRECCLAISANTKKAKAKLPVWLPSTSSLEILFREHLDIRAVVKKPLLRCLLEHTRGEEDRGKLAILCSKEGGQEYLSQIRDKQVTLLELLSMFPSCVPPVTLLLEHLPRLNPRPYSLSSSPLATPTTISWVFTLVTTPRPGLATTWMSNLKDSSKMIIQPRTGNHFRPPQDLGTSYVMVGAGSGLGPFIGFLEERRARKRNGEKITGECWLVFGCRNRDKDFLFKEMIEELLEEGILSKLDVCFSREEDGPKYVQDSLKQKQKILVEWLVEKKASFYVCGDANGMAKRVQEVVEELLEEEMGWAEGEGVNFVKDMRVNKKYKEDIWT